MLLTGNLQIKVHQGYPKICIGIQGALNLSAVEIARLWREGVPKYVEVQVMHQLAVTGKQAADVAVLLGGQQQPGRRGSNGSEWQHQITLLFTITPAATSLFHIVKN